MELNIDDIWYNRSENEKKSAVLTTIIMVLLFLFMIFFKLSSQQDKKDESGVLIDFGTTETGLGDVNEADASAGDDVPINSNTPISEPTPTPASKPTPTPPSTVSQEILAAKNNQIALAKQQKELEKQRLEEIKKQKLLAEQQAKLEAEKQAQLAKQKAFQDKMNQGIKGNKGPGGDGTTQGSEGNTKGPGNMGDPFGTPGGQYEGTPGNGGTGASLSLGNRKFVNKPDPKNNSNKEGIVVIKIKVDNKGNILDAQYQSKGSTTNDSYLVNLSIKTVLNETKVTSDPNAAEEQFGTITIKYN
jgi:outer membrane biosynthesis protein TonB